MILETFKTLSSEEQKILLEKLVYEAGQMSSTIKIEDVKHLKLYDFAKKQWPLMSIQFFNELLRRWEILHVKSYGDCVTSCAEIGDVYLKSKSFDNKSYDEWPFEDNLRMYFFYNKIFEDCSWSHMYISKLNPEAEWADHFSIKTLMELPIEEFNLKMEEYGFL